MLVFAQPVSPTPATAFHFLPPRRPYYTFTSVSTDSNTALALSGICSRGNKFHCTAAELVSIVHKTIKALDG